MLKQEYRKKNTFQHYAFIIEAPIAISFSCKIDFETGTNIREKWGHFILM